MNKIYREGLPAIPARLLNLPVERGYPVPWFVAEIDGHYDFRVIDSRKFEPALKQRLCWVCGQKLGSTLAFTIGPMCAINRTISEPPSHRECAEFSIIACPFLNQTETKRNVANMPKGTVDSAGIGLKRQPGAICLWLTKTFSVMRDPTSDGVLFKIGDPQQVFWFREGRTATREEVMESIDSGYPILKEMADKDGGFAPLQLAEMRKTVVDKFVPK